jgi:hypothetical protein
VAVEKRRLECSSARHSLVRSQMIRNLGVAVVKELRGEGDTGVRTELLIFVGGKLRISILMIACNETAATGR